MATTHYNTKIVLYRGVPFGIDYNHTLAPSALDTKVECLNGHFAHDTYTELQTIHMNSATDAGTMRLVVKAADAYRYNYAYVEDPQHGLKFCAFITGCRYINDANSNPTDASSVYKCVYEFAFVKDLLMTYLNAFYIGPCPIIRHTSTNVFDNGHHAESISLETVDCSIMRTNDVLGYVVPSTDTYTVLWCNFNWDKASDPALVPDSTLNGIVNCVLGIVYTSVSDVKTDLKALAAEQGFELLGVSAIPNFMYDWDAAPALSTLHGKPLVDRYVRDKHSFTIMPKSHFKSVSETNAGITVGNKKCFYFPFAKFIMESNAGSIVELAPEYLNKTSGVGGNIQFDVTCNVGRPCSYTVEPREYGVVSNAHSPNIKCTTSTFPEGCATLDSYAMYLSQRYKFPDNPIGMIGQHIVESVPGMMGAAASLSMGNVASVGTETAEGSGLYEHAGVSGAGAAGIGGAVSSVAQAALTNDAMQRKADAIIGAVPSPDTDYIRNNVNVIIKYNAVNPKELKGLDDYFERFGYAQGGEINTPDLDGRPRYVYCQTGGTCFESPECNASENSKINAIMMNGVMYWRTSAIGSGNNPLIYGGNGTDPIDDVM